MSETVKHGEHCRSLLSDARLLQETYRRERNLARKELQDVRVELAHAYDLRDAERKRGDRAEADRDRLDHQIAEVKDELRQATAQLLDYAREALDREDALRAEIATLRAAVARPLIPDGSSATPATSGAGSSGAPS